MVTRRQMLQNICTSRLINTSHAISPPKVEINCPLQRDRGCPWWGETLEERVLGKAEDRNEEYGKYFKNGKEPARETVAVKTLPKNVRVEISMIAYKDS